MSYPKLHPLPFTHIAFPYHPYFFYYAGQQNLTFFFGARGKISVPKGTFNAEFKYVSSFSPSHTVCFVTVKLNVQYWSIYQAPHSTTQQNV
jgi:hypothetical protein